MGTIRYIGEHTAEQIRRMPFGKALEALTEAEKLPSPHAPSQSQREVLLATTDIVTIESVFQHRDVAAGKYDSESHIRTLTNVLKALPADQRRLDPILVVPIDSSWICIDGHHRLEAYKKAGVSEVPAEVFTGGIRQAVIVAGEANSKTKLPMSPRDRMNAAWRIVSAGLASKRETAIATGVAERTVANMRTLAKDLLAMEETPSHYTYHEAREVARGGRLGERGEDWEQEQVRRFEDEMSRLFGKHAHRNRDFIAQALENRFPSVIETVIERNALSFREEIQYLFQEADQMEMMEDDF